MFRGLFKTWLLLTVIFTVHSYNLHQGNPELPPITWHEAFASVMVGWIIFGGAALTYFAPFTWPVLGILFYARSKRTWDHVDNRLNSHNPEHEHFEHAFNHKMHHHKYHAKHSHKKVR